MADRDGEETISVEDVMAFTKFGHDRAGLSDQDALAGTNSPPAGPPPRSSTVISVIPPAGISRHSGHTAYTKFRTDPVVKRQHKNHQVHETHGRQRSGQQVRLSGGPSTRRFQGCPQGPSHSGVSDEDAVALASTARRRSSTERSLWPPSSYGAQVRRSGPVWSRVLCRVSNPRDQLVLRQ